MSTASRKRARKAKSARAAQSEHDKKAYVAEMVHIAMGKPMLTAWSLPKGLKILMSANGGPPQEFDLSDLSVKPGGSVPIVIGPNVHQVQMHFTGGGGGGGGSK